MPRTRANTSQAPSTHNDIQGFVLTGSAGVAPHATSRLCRDVGDVREIMGQTTCACPDGMYVELDEECSE